MHPSDFFIEPGDVAHDGVNADVQNLGIKRSELLQSGVEHRQLRGSSWRPVKRMESDYDVLPAAVIAKFDPKLAIALDGREVEVGCVVSYLQGHKLERT